MARATRVRGPLGICPQFHRVPASRSVPVLNGFDATGSNGTTRGNLASGGLHVVEQRLWSYWQIVNFVFRPHIAGRTAGGSPVSVPN
jgi:hypothetical protein